MELPECFGLNSQHHNGCFGWGERNCNQTHPKVDCLEKAGLDVKVIFTDHKEHKKAAVKHEEAIVPE